MYLFLIIISWLLTLISYIIYYKYRQLAESNLKYLLIIDLATIWMAVFSTMTVAFRFRSLLYE